MKNDAIRDIRAQVKAIREALAAIEYRLSELEDTGTIESRGPTQSEAPAKRPPGMSKQPATVESAPSTFKLKVRRGGH